MVGPYVHSIRQEAKVEEALAGFAYVCFTLYLKLRWRFGAHIPGKSNHWQHDKKE